MLRRIFHRWGFNEPVRLTRRYASRSSSDDKDEMLLKQDLGLPGISLDEIDEIMAENSEDSITQHYPNTDVHLAPMRKPIEGHSVMVIQPWISYANFNEQTAPDLQLDECVSLGNTIHNWKVIDKRIVFANQLHRKQILGPKAFEQLKDEIHKNEAVTAVFFGVELLSAIQLGTLEKELRLAVYDRFTVVLNIFRQHARTKEAKLQVALAELPYIRSHLREINQSSEFSSAQESLKMLVGGIGEKFYHQRLNILKKRESRLRELLIEVRKQRDITKKLRRKSDVPTISIVGYTNCGKTSLIKYLTQDERLVPKDQLFATLDVTTHIGQLPSSKTVFYLDTVGFISRIPTLLIEAFSTTLKDVQESDLILHLLDVTHPDHKLQYATVIKALQSLKMPKQLLETRLTIGNKADLISAADSDRTMIQREEVKPKCDLNISCLRNTNLDVLVEMLDNRLLSNLRHETLVIRIENGGKKYSWLRKHASMVDCQVDETDQNYLICRVIMSPAATGRWYKFFGSDGILEKFSK